MAKDWATATFDSEVRVQSLIFGHRVFNFPQASDAHLLIPVHAYEYSDHFKEKGAQMLTSAGDDYRVTSAYFGGRNPVGAEYGPLWHENRLLIEDDRDMIAWHRSPSGNWTMTGKRSNSEKDHFVELDTMTEVQYERWMDLPELHKGEIITTWRWVRDTDGDWYRPDDVLELQRGSNNDGEYSKIDFSIDEDDGRFYFFHYVEP